VLLWSKGGGQDGKEKSRRKNDGGKTAGCKDTGWERKSKESQGRPQHYGHLEITYVCAIRQEIKSNIGGFMLGWAATFFVIAIIAALLGFTGIAGSAMGIAKILFILFLILAVIIFIFGRTRSA